MLAKAKHLPSHYLLGIAILMKQVGCLGLRAIHIRGDMTNNIIRKT